jgi:hypothetical protein
MLCGQSVFSLYCLSRQYSQNVFLVPIVSVLRSIVENRFIEIPEGWSGLSNRDLQGAQKRKNEPQRREGRKGFLFFT